MSIIRIDHPPDTEELVLLSEIFGEYIKLVADIRQNILYGGGELHADMEKILLDLGSNQNDIWGGGINSKTKAIDCRAVANIRPGINKSMEILNNDNRVKFITIVKKYFPEYHD